MAFFDVGGSIYPALLSAEPIRALSAEQSIAALKATCPHCDLPTTRGWGGTHTRSLAACMCPSYISSVTIKHPTVNPPFCSNS
jgi:nitrite reductase/ring-hydroxylating ferredoxin subunit